MESAASGPCNFAVATARFNVTSGEGCMRSSAAYKASIPAQSVSSARTAREWVAAMAACSWYGPGTL